MSRDRLEVWIESRVQQSKLDSHSEGHVCMIEESGKLSQPMAPARNPLSYSS